MRRRRAAAPARRHAVQAVAQKDRRVRAFLRKNRLAKDEWPDVVMRRVVAASIRDICGERYRVPLSPQEFFARFNVVGVYPDDAQPVDARLERHRDGCRIFVAANRAKTRTRFSVFHEIAHLYFDCATPTDKHARPTACEEWLCDVAASEFLMPAEIFDRATAAFKPTFDSLNQLARFFGVSIPALSRRLEERYHGDLWIRQWEAHGYPRTGLDLCCVGRFTAVKERLINGMQFAISTLDAGRKVLWTLDIGAQELSTIQVTHLGTRILTVSVLASTRSNVS